MILLGLERHKIQMFTYTLRDRSSSAGTGAEIQFLSGLCSIGSGQISDGWQGKTYKFQTVVAIVLT
jgi:hypothetical protein